MFTVENTEKDKEKNFESPITTQTTAMNILVMSSSSFFFNFLIKYRRYCLYNFVSYLLLSDATLY